MASVKTADGKAEPTSHKVRTRATETGLKNVRKRGQITWGKLTKKGVKPKSRGLDLRAPSESKPRKEGKIGQTGQG